VRALVGGQISGSLTTTQAFQYGGAGPLDPKLIVTGFIENGTPIEFTIDGQPATPGDLTKAVFQSGAITELDLTYTPAGGGGGGGGSGGGGTAPTTTATTTATTTKPTIRPVHVVIDGQETMLPVSDTGVVLVTVTQKSADGQVEIDIPEGTTITMPPGEEWDAISVTPEPEVQVPPPPAGALVIGIPYNCQPSGISFNPPIDLVWQYQYDGEDEAQLKVAFFNTATGEWVVLPCVVDTENNTITAQVPHFTDFTIILPQAPPTTTPATASATTTATTTSATLTPTATATGTATPTATSSTTGATATPTVTQTVTETSSPSAATEKEGLPWYIIGGAVGGALVAALAVFLVMRRRPARG